MSISMIICGSCAQPAVHGVAFNFPSYVCTECTWHGWVVFYISRNSTSCNFDDTFSNSSYNITNGALNGFVLYSQSTGVTAVS